MSTTNSRILNRMGSKLAAPSRSKLLTTQGFFTKAISFAQICMFPGQTGKAIRNGLVRTKPVKSQPFSDSALLILTPMQPYYGSCTQLFFTKQLFLTSNFLLQTGLRILHPHTRTHVTQFLVSSHRVIPTPSRQEM